MKKFSFKKITAAVSAAAMIATLGTTAFAAVGTPGQGITIEAITKTEVDAEKQIYNIKVDFNSSAANEIGMTMLTYGNSDDSSLSMNTESWTNNTYKNDNTMKIIGVDQISPVTNGNKGSFEFKITTSSTTGAIYLKKGTTAMIALSGDGVTTPVFAPLSINATAGYANPVELSNVQVAANADISEALTAKAKEQSAAIYEKQGDSASLGSVSLENATIGTWTESEGTYTATATLPADTTLSGVDFPSAGLSVSLSATVELTAVNAAKATGVEGFTASTTANEFTKTVNVNDSTTDVTLKAEVVGKKVTLTDELGKVSGTVEITDSMVGTSDTYNSATEGDQTITYTVTVSEGATSNDLLNVPSGGIAVTVKVTATKTPVIEKIELKGDAITVEVTKGETDDATVAAIKSALEAKIASGYEFVVDDDTHISVSDATYTWNVTGSGNSFTATMNITAVTGSGLADMPATGIGATLPTITITVNEGEPVYLGDVNGDGKVNAMDWGILRNHVQKVVINNDLNDPNSLAFKAANVNKTGVGANTLNAMDWGVLRNHIQKVVTNAEISVEIVGYK